jgi:D-alanyl-D-alanine carboxypeptidase/D-alanyl-D-alanine-endopeptidase (penicillin-binding protein 4)
MAGWARRWALVLLLLAAAAQADAESLRARIDAALLRLGPHATVAVRVVSLDTGQVLYERNPDFSLNPASNMKLVTSAAALARLGPDYRFTTRVLAARRPEGGTLRGDLILQGGGDPVLELPDLDRLADALRAAGLRRVRGRLLADDSRYDAERLGAGWSADYESYYYAAQISALTLNRNVATVDVFPGETVGDSARVEVRPVEGYLRVLTRPATGPRGGEARITITRERARNEIRIAGALPLGGEPIRGREVTMEEPALWAAAVFRKLLEERGIRVEGDSELRAAPADAVELAAHVSRPLSEIAPLFNKPSDNLIGELLLKELGFRHRGRGTAGAGSEVVEAWLREIGVPVAGVSVRDGSGLSRLDLLTARAVSELLIHADRAPWKEPFLASLPIAGVDGTLRNRFKGTPAEKNLRAKTGSLLHVSALGGYVTAPGGERRVFSILINQYPGPGTAKRFEDLIGAALAAE